MRDGSRNGTEEETGGLAIPVPRRRSVAPQEEGAEDEVWSIGFNMPRVGQILI